MGALARQCSSNSNLTLAGIPFHSVLASAPALSLPLNSLLPKDIKSSSLLQQILTMEEGFPFPSSFLFFCLAWEALANPISLSIFHSWWCFWSTNWCQGKWAVVGAHGEPGLCRHWWIVQAKRVKELLYSYLRLPHNRLPRMTTPTRVSCWRHVYLYYQYSHLLVLKKSCNLFRNGVKEFHHLFKYLFHAY